MKQTEKNASGNAYVTNNNYYEKCATQKKRENRSKKREHVDFYYN